jgi:hypothetical protein
MAVIALGLAAGACTTLAPRPAPPPTPAVAEIPRTPEAAPPTPSKAHCVPKGFPKAPRYPDTDAALRDAGGAADRYQLLAAGRILRMHRLADLEKLVDDCR